MSQRRTWVLLGLLSLLLLSYYLYEHRYLAQKRSREEAARSLFSIKEAGELELTVKGKRYLLRKGKEGWRIFEPIKAKADEDLLNRMLKRLLEAKKGRVIEEHPRDLSSYGLKEPRASVIVRGEGKEEGILLGDETPTRMDIYAKRMDREAVFVLSGEIWYEVNKDLYDLRDKSIVTFSPREVKEIEASLRGKVIRVRKEGEKWKMILPKEAKADRERIEELLQRLAKGRIKRFYDAPGPMKIYGLAPPRLLLRIKEGPTLRFGKAEEEGIYAQVKGRKEVVLLDRSFAELLPKGVNDWRDKYPLAFNPEKVRRITFAYPSREGFSCVRGPEGWKILPQGMKADGDKISAFLWKLKGVAVKEFLPLQKAGVNKDHSLLDLLIEGEKERWSLRLLKGKALYLYEEGKEEIYRIASKDEELFLKEPDDFKYKRIIPIKEGEVRELRIAFPHKKEIFLLNEGGRWVKKRPKGEVENWKVTSLLWRLMALEYLEEFRKGEVEGAFSPPQVELTLRPDEGKPEVVLTLGKKRGEGVLARIRRGEKEGYYLVKEDLLKTIEDYFGNGK